MSRSGPTTQRNAWYQTLRANSRVMELFEVELQRECGMSLAWYDVLSCLYLSPDHAMRMCDLAEQVLMSRSWLTRRVDQLVKADLVERCSAENDGRGVQARLTRTGKRTFIKLQRSHGTAIDRHFSAYLSAEDAEVLIRVMGKIAESADRALKADTPIAPKTNALKS